jgi:hypothetical protein
LCGDDKGVMMIVQKETLNQIADLRWKGFGIQSIAAILGLMVKDVDAAIKGYKLIAWYERDI